MYVLFKEVGSMFYFIASGRDECNRLLQTTSRKKAMEFATRREAYDFGGENGCGGWRVGER